MKYFVALILGMVVGVIATALIVYYNPLYARNEISPLAVTDNEIFTLGYSAVAGDSLLYTNNGESATKPHPARVLQLWEPTVRLTTVMAALLTNSRGELAGIGIKISSRSERTRLIDAAALVDSVWHVYLSERGSFFVEQTENHWSYLRNVVAPAYLSSGDNWKGSWRGNLTSGPTPLRTARVFGASGDFAGIETEAVEALSAQAYAVGQGRVAADGELTIEIPAVAAERIPGTEDQDPSRDPP
jgi:hypothetical protein